MPAATVIIPTFNRAHLLPRAVASAQQAGASVEVVVVDNASTDNTKEVCDALGTVRYLRLNSNGGPSVARNAGIRVSTSEVVAFLDDDDVLLPGSIDHQIARLQVDPRAALSYGHILCGDEYCRPTGGTYWPSRCATHSLPHLPEGDIFRQAIISNPIVVHSAVVRRHLLAEMGGFDTNLVRCEDWDFWVRLTARYPVVAVQEPVGIARMSNSSSHQLTADRSAMHRSLLLLQSKWLELPRAQRLNPEERRRIRQQAVRSSALLLFSDGVFELKAGELCRGLSWLLAALKLHPTSVLSRIARAAARLPRNVARAALGTRR